MAKTISEFDIIDRWFNAVAVERDDVLLGIGDDAALLRVDGDQALVVAVDTLVAGRHFPEGTAAGDIGHKALAVNLSDLAAMGAAPAWATLSLTLPEADESWLDGFARGFHQLAARFGVALVGGDTTRGPLSVTVQVMGRMPAERAMRRDTARPGQLIFVTGTPGDAAFALHRLQASAPVDATLLGRLHRPEPRVDFGVALSALKASAIDVSDGLLADLGHVLAASDCGATLYVDRLPRSAALRDQPADVLLPYQLGGGDDYELCFCVDPDRENEVARIAAQHKLQVTAIGVVQAEAGIRCVRADGTPYQPGVAGFDHFT